MCGAALSQVESSPELSPDGATVYVGSYDNKLYAVRTSDGTKLWEFLTGGVSFDSSGRAPRRAGG